MGINESKSPPPQYTEVDHSIIEVTQNDKKVLSLEDKFEKFSKKQYLQKEEENKKLEDNARRFVDFFLSHIEKESDQITAKIATNGKRYFQLNGYGGKRLNTSEIEIAKSLFEEINPIYRFDYCGRGYFLYI